MKQFVYICLFLITKKCSSDYLNVACTKEHIDSNANYIPFKCAQSKETDDKVVKDISLDLNSSLVLKMNFKINLKLDSLNHYFVESSLGMYAASRYIKDGDKITKISYNVHKLVFSENTVIACSSFHCIYITKEQKHNGLTIQVFKDPKNCPNPLTVDKGMFTTHIICLTPIELSSKDTHANSEYKFNEQSLKTNKIVLFFGKHPDDSEDYSSDINVFSTETEKENYEFKDESEESQVYKKFEHVCHKISTERKVIIDDSCNKEYYNKELSNIKIENKRVKIEYSEVSDIELAKHLIILDLNEKLNYVLPNVFEIATGFTEIPKLLEVEHWSGSTPAIVIQTYAGTFVPHIYAEDMKGSLDIPPQYTLDEYPLEIIYDPTMKPENIISKESSFFAKLLGNKPLLFGIISLMAVCVAGSIYYMKITRKKTVQMNDEIVDPLQFQPNKLLESALKGYDI